MDQQRFLEELPGLYEHWGQSSARPRSDLFSVVLRNVRGMTTAAVLQLLNRAVACLEDDEIYFEAGCFQGATLIGALLNHPTRLAYAVDNFSEFDIQNENCNVLGNNLERFGVRERVRFHNGNFEGFLLGLHGSGLKVGVYFYDAAHDYRSTLMGLLLAVPLLAERALIVLDDSNDAMVKQASRDFLTLHPEVRLLLDIPTPRNCHATFWNGVHVLGWNVQGH